MAVYQYEAKNMQGTVIKGNMEAADEKSVAAFLRQKNYYPVKIKIYKEALNIDLQKYKKVSIKEIAIFCREFAFTLSAGISIVRAVEIVKQQSESNKLKNIFENILEDIQKGKTLSFAFGKSKDIPPMLVNMIAVGEASGTLDSIMERMANYYDKEYKQQQKIKQALTYPAAVSIFAMVVVNILVIKVLPIFVDMIVQNGGGELPLPTRIVMGMSSVLINNYLLIISIGLILYILVRQYLRGSSGREAFDRLKMNMPIVGKIYTKIVTARFARTFGTLMGSGVSLIESITICSDVVGNKVIQDILLSSAEELKKGTSLGETLEDRKIFPLMLTQMIKIGEESGTLEEILEKTAEFYDGEVDTTTNQLTTLLEPIIIIVLGVVVGFIVISIIMPIFQMYNSMSSGL